MSLETVAKQTGLNINAQKTKSMRLNTNQQDCLKIDDSTVEDVQQFTYLGSIVSTSGGTDEDILARKKKAQQIFSMLKPVWRSNALRTSTKLRILNTNVKSVLLYGSETWRETAASIKSIQTFVNKRLRNILNIRWPNKISNNELWRRTKQQPTTQTIRARKWKWIRHTLRKKDTHITKQALEWNPQEHRKRGRPKNTWRRGLTTELSKIGKTWRETKRIAMDRKKWRETVVALCPPWDEVD
ncbi:uncharacterized protein LOC134692458 [Mytilus trossulus]|uniref:uncharacterized protein LOC134692458 n=1 Tax=Mytilus trossulus TaxID=6551 RepID=UPI003006E7C2